jgi:hypothetical protein
MTDLSCESLAAARAKLGRPSVRKESGMALLGAAGFFATAALALSAAVVLGPPEGLQMQHARSAASIAIY